MAKYIYNCIQTNLENKRLHSWLENNSTLKGLIMNAPWHFSSDRLWETYSHLKDAAKGAKILSIKNTLNLKVTLTHRTLTGLAVQG